MEKETTIQLRNVTTGYRVKGKYKEISTRLNAVLHIGEMTCLLGPNGAGKSTLLRTMAGFQPSLGGEVSVNKKSLKSYSPKDLAKAVSVVLTQNSDIKNLTVEEVLAIGRSPYTGFWGRLRERDRKMIDKCLGWVGIEELRSRKMHTLSDGERQKVMIAKAIAQETPIILLDEPTAFLDYPSKVAMMLLLHRLAKALKKTVFLSTHDLEHALQISDQVWLLDRDKGLTTGMPEDLCAEAHISRYFQREGVGFDPETCTFSIEHEVAREVLIDGNPHTLQYKLAARALLRNAIRPIRSMSDAQMESTRNDVVLRVPGDGTYRLLDHGKEAICVNKMEHILGIVGSTIVKNQIQTIRDEAQMTPYE